MPWRTATASTPTSPEYMWATRRYDGRLLHCGGANRSDELRVLFYLTFRAADGGQVGGEDGGRRATAADGLTLESLMAGCVSAS